MWRMALIVGLMVSGCATMKDWEKLGLTEEIIFRLEAEDWGPQIDGGPLFGWPAKAGQMGVPENARPIALRKIRCRRERQRFVDGTKAPDSFTCRYLVDYGRDGKIEGTYENDYVVIGKDEHGKWSNDWIVVT
jgi:hypothetical protein